MATSNTESAERRILRRARELLARGWAQGVYCRDSSGHALLLSEAYGRSDVCYCIAGAVSTAAVDLGKPSWGLAAADAARLLQKAGRLSGDGPWMAIGTYNDARWRTQADMLALIDAAIAGAAL